jgi:hypothetical protein
MPGVATQGGVQVTYCTECHDTAIEFDGKPARVIAAKPGTTFWDVPGDATPGPHQVKIVPSPGSAPVILTVFVVRLSMSAGQTELLRGQSTRLKVTLAGLEKLPASAWQSGTPPAHLLDLEQLRRRAPDFQPPTAADSGVVVLILENQATGVIRMGNHGDRIVLVLHRKDWAKGPYVFEEDLQSLQTGGFGIVGTVALFLHPVTAGRDAMRPR